MQQIRQANALLSQGQFEQAAELFQQIMQQQPKDMNALWGMARIEYLSDRPEQSIQWLQQCIAVNPKQLPPYLLIAEQFKLLHQYANAKKTLKNTFLLFPDQPPAMFAYAQFLIGSREYSEAERVLRQSIQHQPDSVTAYLYLSRIKRLSSTSTETQFLRRYLEQTSCTDKHKIAIHFVLFEIFNAERQYQIAQQHLRLGNTIQRKSIGFSTADMKNYFNDIKTVFDHKRLAQRSSAKPAATLPSLTPIFIVGQPRSGSTLLEQLLAHHDEIHAGGEQTIIGGKISQLMHNLTGQHFPIAAKHLTQEQLEDLGDSYLKKLQRIAPSSHFITDKMPANFQSLGLIKSILPHAKIIHITRHPVDTCFSIYRHHFEAEEPYFCDLDDIGDYQLEYQSIMYHWEKVLPNQILTIRFEDLVSQTERTLKHVLDFCGLPFDQKCLTPDPDAYIDTLSDNQIGQGVNINAIKQPNWLPYQLELSSLINKLSDLTIAYEQQR